MKCFYESSVDIETLSFEDAPVLILLAPIDSAGIGPFAGNLSEEGYHVVVVPYPGKGNMRQDIRQAFLAAPGLDRRSKNVALITVGLEAQDAGLVGELMEDVDVGAVVHYGPRFPVLPRNTEPPYVCHVSGEDTHHLSTLQRAALDEIIPRSNLPFDPTLFKPRASVGPRKPKACEYFSYPDVSCSDPCSWAFAFPFSSNTRHFAFAKARTDADRSASSLSYSRTLQLLQDAVGPRFDREQLWDRHTHYEFVERDSFKTMQTMVSDPFVNHVSSLTGGAGHAQLARFYEHHFTKSSPPDTKLVGLSRTLGPDRVIDEMIFECTHTQEVRLSFCLLLAFLFLDLWLHSVADQPAD